MNFHGIRVQDHLFAVKVEQMIFVRKTFSLFWNVFCVSTVISHQYYFLTQCGIHGWKASDVSINFMSHNNISQGQICKDTVGQLC